MRCLYHPFLLIGFWISNLKKYYNRGSEKRQNIVSFVLYTELPFLPIGTRIICRLSVRLVNFRRFLHQRTRFDQMPIIQNVQFRRWYKERSFAFAYARWIQWSFDFPLLYICDGSTKKFTVIAVLHGLIGTVSHWRGCLRSGHENADCFQEDIRGQIKATRLEFQLEMGEIWIGGT